MLNEWLPLLKEWLHLALRWTHIFAGILWVGTTFFFTWLDGRLTEEERDARAGERAQVWMVHSGGFYVVEKQKGVELLPRHLHWFRYEALATWLSGFALLVLLYYLSDGLTYAGEDGLGGTAAVLVALGTLVAGWIIYDLLWRSPLGRNEKAGAVACYLLLVAASYGLTRIFSGRAAYIHVGAIMGTIMFVNVWERILPAQRQLIAATKEGREVDMTLAARAKQRSKHNTFMAVPVVFTMLSNHFATSTYGHQYNWLILSALILLGFLAAKFVRRA
ncbi:MAG TPA: urate hydroxylase PuuD [Pyrinomonadaceae bacterium]|nr:urate hydroxylase PuuD [Pyrinomonadaceae bacterium]